VLSRMVQRIDTWEKAERAVLRWCAVLIVVLGIFLGALSVVGLSVEAEAVGPQQYEVITIRAGDRPTLADEIAANLEGRMPECIIGTEVESADEYSYTAVLILSC